MPSLQTIIDSKGRLPYERLRELTANLSLKEFTEQAQFPFLVGKQLYEGELRRKIGGTTSTSTMRFDAAEVKNHLAEFKARIGKEDESKTTPDAAMPPAPPSYGGIAHAIYMLKKRRFSPLLRFVPRNHSFLCVFI